MQSFTSIFKSSERLTIAGAPEGVDALVLASAARARSAPGILHVARDEPRMATLAAALAFFAPDLDVLQLPAWDCLPYDRVSPNPQVLSRRVEALTRLAMRPAERGPRIILTTVSAILQRLPPRAMFANATFTVAVGSRLVFDELSGFLGGNGYHRAETVREPGEFALRGGIVDIFPSGAAEPVRIDLFGDEVESIRTFDSLSQRSTGTEDSVLFMPVSEILLDTAAIASFRTGYRELFGAVGADDPLYEAISAGRRHLGMEHWLPLFHEGLETLADYLPEAAFTLDYQVEEAVEARLEQIAEYYEARRVLMEARRTRRKDRDEDAAAVYKPIPPAQLYLEADEWRAILAARRGGAFSPFAAPDTAPATLDAGGRMGLSFAAARARVEENVFDAVGLAILEAREDGRRAVVAGYTAGSRDRLAHVLGDHGIDGVRPLDRWADVAGLAPEEVAIVVLELENGFATAELAVFTEQDILGDRLARAARPRRRADQFITEASSLAPGDHVVHVDHGIGRYEGLETLDIGGAPHDCLCVVYGGGDKLFVPVESIEMLSRYGSEDAGVQLDRLGGAGWQARKSRVKGRIRDIAESLLAVAAARHLRPGMVMTPPGGLYDEFAARFPYPETEDQLRAIDQTLEDLASGQPMDRLVCGDVGFGKTEVALRAIFAAVMSGAQAAIVVPTTLLCRQHLETLAERFAGLPVEIAQLSRFVAPKRAAEVKRGLADGRTDIVVGTHALLGRAIEFKNLGLLIVDEEQHFGVAQKERLKQLREDVHVLTLTATPIPRTLQLAMAGVREMSVIATPPIDRLAVRTFVLPYDPVVVREAILREHFRGGQTFFVCPRIEDLRRVRVRIEALVPEVRVGVAHGQMPVQALEDVMSAFYEQAFDVLLCTNIIESGLDIPTANTMIVHRADMFGLSQLYQLRGRIGRAKVRAYAYLTLPPGMILKEAAARRLQVMQTLDHLGAGFTLASHDMDIRGAGNLLGEEQSGHIREVGVELYQSMLQEAVARLHAEGAAGTPGAEGGAAGPAPEWTPQITVGTPVLIPEAYVADLSVRLGLYRRLAGLTDARGIEGFGAELIDRFGPLPEEVENLFRIVEIKRLCLESGIEKVDAGPKGAVVTFRENQFANPAGLIDFITTNAGTAKLRPDHKLVYRRDWSAPAARITGLRHLLRAISVIARGAEAA